MIIPTIALLSAIALRAVSSLAAATDAVLSSRGITTSAAVLVTTTDICVEGNTKLVLDVSLNERRKAYAEYGERNIRGRHDLDHLLCVLRVSTT